jgi:sulfide:quinone oxidoreductase
VAAGEIYGRVMTARDPKPRVVVVGGGVAALEAILALRALAGPRSAITMLAPDEEFAPPAASVATPFGFGLPATLPLEEFAERYEVGLQRSLLAEVNAGEHLAIPVAAAPIVYDHLLIATGARRRAVVRGALTFRGPDEVGSMEAVLDDIVAGRARRLVIAIPPSASWPLPAYELAIMAAVELRSRGVATPDVSVVTPESAPLEVFGAAAGEAVAAMLQERDITLHTSTVPVEFVEGSLRTKAGPEISADRVVALPETIGPYIPGLPHDALGFIPTDSHGAVTGRPDVYAAGDATTFPLRQGGLAAQQADAAAESIALAMGAIASARPFRPVLRGVLLTGGGPLYLRTVIGAGETPVARRLGAGPSSSVGHRPMWWPPAKVAGRYLGPLMSTARPRALALSPLEDVGYRQAAEGGHEAARGSL